MAAPLSLSEISVPCPACAEPIALPIECHDGGANEAGGITVFLSARQETVNAVVAEHVALHHPEAADA